MSKWPWVVEERPDSPLATNLRLGFIILSVQAAYLLAHLECGSPMFDGQLEAWHRRCDGYAGKPIETPARRDCARELHELTVYAKMKGLTSEVEELTAYAKAVGWDK